jgi:hypothetical protein
MITLFLKLRYLLLEILKTLGLALTRFARRKSVAGSLHGDSVLGVINNDGRKRLVAPSRVHTRDGRVSTVTSSSGRVSRLASMLRRGLDHLELLRLLARRVIEGRVLRDGRFLREEWVPRVVGASTKVIAAKVGRHIEVVVELG